MPMIEKVKTSRNNQVIMILADGRKILEVDYLTCLSAIVMVGRVKFLTEDHQSTRILTSSKHMLT